ncbi:CCA tRNA nucleotidyltransferase [Rhizobium rhizoryzae]|uniref:CCA tRNA nucleotidyltransferase n=1 Tax=Rhizobium rhizoryzae TaxID=451876 RepID=UPI00289BB15E|nr:CCA tRNA nucleotidyltransferase [Rhizobium rhizoryzae]
MTVNLAHEAWLQDAAVQRVFALLNADGGEGRVVGGAVRNALMGAPISDVDFATTNLPQVVMERAAAAGIKAVPTGIDHGTVTLVIDGRGFEVTTLRQDVETDGRRAKVSFGTDWQADAERRDFTINALYATADGDVVDLVNGLPDIETKTLRFIGDAHQRIAEDYLRVLRFFRFFAYYGSGRPDADGLRASARAKDKLDSLSAERVWSELRKLLAAPDPSRALLWMRTSGVLTAVLPETEKWGIDAIHGLVATETALKWQPDPMLRLAAIIPPDGERIRVMADRLRLSRAEAEALQSFAAAPSITPDMAGAALDRALYRQGLTGIIMRLRLALASARAKAVDDNDEMLKAAKLDTLLKRAIAFVKPQFPVSGADLVELGLSPGPKFGKVLGQLEAEWVERNFVDDRAALTTRLATIIEQAD